MKQLVEPVPKIRCDCPDSASNSYLQLFPYMLLSSVPGDVAQLGERDNRTVEVRGSSPLISTLYYAIKDDGFRGYGGQP